jgi:hypothetical protein
MHKNSGSRIPALESAGLEVRQVTESSILGTIPFGIKARSPFSDLKVTDHRATLLLEVNHLCQQRIL